VQLHLLPCYPTHSSPSPTSGACESGWCGLCLCFSIMIASDDASVASNDKIDRQNEWRRKMKEDAKRSAQNQLRD
jgi:hypothetical protein